MTAHCPSTPTAEQPLRVAVLGFGNVARALCELLAAGHGRAGEAERAVDIELVACASRRRGLLVAPPGGCLSAEQLARRPDEAAWQPWPQGWDGARFAQEIEADVLLELTTLDPVAGQPAIRHIEAALRAGKHVVTANKGPLAWDYARLAALARQCGRRFLFEATVMDGAPVFNLHRHCLPGCRVQSLKGVLNSTTNVILTAMERGVPYSGALAEAQRMGIAEADPSLDVDGWDAAVKLCVLANVLMGASVTPPEVARSGIGQVTRADVARALAAGQAIRLVAEAARTGDGGCVAVVAPRCVPRDSALGRATGTSSVLTIQTDLLGQLTITEESPQLPQTAYGVLADLLEFASGG